jgi:hypothetical protein
MAHGLLAGGYRWTGSGYPRNIEPAWACYTDAMTH